MSPSRDDPHSYTRRVNTDQRLDLILIDICLPGAQWRHDSKEQPYQLERHDLKLVTWGWLEFIQHSIIPTSNRSEVTIDRAMMIHCIILGNEVEVHRVIPQKLYNIVAKASTSARLAFPHIIFRLCEAACIRIDRDTPIDIDRPIIRRGMEYAKELGRAPPQEPVPLLSRSNLRCLSDIISLLVIIRIS
ncbi:hypothetical protein AHAS_Ahas10G0081600 [Arachis hypogaea]